MRTIPWFGICLTFPSCLAQVPVEHGHRRPLWLKRSVPGDRLSQKNHSFLLGFKMLTEFLLTRGCRDPRSRWPTVPRQKISSSRWTRNLKKPSLCKINPKFPIELVPFFPLALLKGVAMKGNGGPPLSQKAPPQISPLTSD